MRFSKLSQVFLVAVGFSAPSLACVQYSCNINWNTMQFNAALTDNGGQTCAIQNEGFSSGVADFQLSCWGGYSADFNRDNGVVNYAHGSFSGSFGTTSENYQDGPFGDQYTYWTANVWGC